MKIIVFTATWCGPCKNYKELLKKARLEVDYIDVDENSDVQEEHDAGELPTTIILSEDDHENCTAVYTSLGNVELNRAIGALESVADIKQLVEDAEMVEGMLKDKPDFAELYLEALREGMASDEALVVCAEAMEK